MPATAAPMPSAPAPASAPPAAPPAAPPPAAPPLAPAPPPAAPPTAPAAAAPLITPAPRPPVVPASDPRTAVWPAEVSHQAAGPTPMTSGRSTALMVARTSPSSTMMAVHFAHVSRWSRTLRSAPRGRLPRT
ncbi:hypothetical protein C6401_11265 [Arthrobacter woluwensis]|nr:hypothetical protein C6401_11265 [Arthrobacter woluwensis]